MQAQHGEFEITAERDITLTACKGKVTMAAKEEILLTSGGSYIRIKGGNIEIRCPDVVSSNRPGNAVLLSTQ
jgi:type VI secretion system secreted protein VgrG